MLKISRLADYAVVLMHRLSIDTSKTYSANELADRCHVPAPTVSKVLKLLSDAKLVTSVRGVQGGYYLARLAQEISIADILLAIDGDMALTDCSLTDSTCSLLKHCELRSNWRYINDQVSQLLSTISILDMQSSVVRER